MKSRFIHLVLLSTIISGCDVSLVGDVTPPPDAIVANQATLAPVPTPAGSPNLLAGAEIYTSRCAPCHGETGLGDGEQADQLPFFPAAIGDPDLAQANSPENWFRAISTGRITRNMPPFESALSVQERWDVLAYVYSLGWDTETLTRGEQIYDENRAEIDALLNGTSAIASDLSLIDALQLPAHYAQALTAYLQAKSLEMASVGEAGLEVGAEAPDGNVTTIGRFTGHVIYGSGEELPADLQARLYGFDHTDQVVFETTTVSSDGTFSFSDISIASGRIFFVQVDYKDLSFFSEFLTVDGQAGTYGLDVPVYDSTSNISTLAAERVQLFFDFPRPGVIRVVESVTISNLGDKAVAPDDDGQPVLHFTIPEQAGNLIFQEGELGDRYIADETGFSDTRAVIPGIHSVELFFAYELPYLGSMEFPIHFDLPTKTLVVLLPEDVEIQGDKLHLQGHETIEGITYLSYSGEVGYSRGEELNLRFSGTHPLRENDFDFLNDDNLVIGLVALTAAVGFAWLWLRSTNGTSYASVGPALDEIVSLDKLF